MQGESNYKWALEAVKWGADFLVTAVERDSILLHIGNITADHAYTGHAEFYPEIDRNIRYAGAGVLRLDTAWNAPKEASSHAAPYA